MRRRRRPVASSASGSDIDAPVFIDTQGLRVTAVLRKQNGDPITAADLISIEADELDADGNSIGGFGALVQAKDFAPDGTLDMLLRPNIGATTLRFPFGAGPAIEVALPGIPTIAEVDIGNDTYIPPP